MRASEVTGTPFQYLCLVRERWVKVGPHRSLISQVKHKYISCEIVIYYYCATVVVCACACVIPALCVKAHFNAVPQRFTNRDELLISLSINDSLLLYSVPRHC